MWITPMLVNIINQCLDVKEKIKIKHELPSTRDPWNHIHAPYSMVFCLSDKTTIWIEFCVKIKGFNHRRRKRTLICQGFNLAIVKREEILNLETATSENWIIPGLSSNANGNSS